MELRFITFYYIHFKTFIYLMYFIAFTYSHSIYLLYAHISRNIILFNCIIFILAPERWLRG